MPNKNEPNQNPNRDRQDKDKNNQTQKPGQRSGSQQSNEGRR